MRHKPDEHVLPWSSNTQAQGLMGLNYTEEDEILEGFVVVSCST